MFSLHWNSEHMGGVSLLQTICPHPLRRQQTSMWVENMKVDFLYKKSLKACTPKIKSCVILLYQSIFWYHENVPVPGNQTHQAQSLMSLGILSLSSWSDRDFCILNTLCYTQSSSSQRKSGQMQQQNKFYRKVNVVREGPTASIQATISNLLQLYLFDKNSPFSLRKLPYTLNLHCTPIFNIEIKSQKINILL